jgi:hypothetical protein
MTYYFLVKHLLTMERVRRIKVIADYDCWPLWHDGSPNGDVGDIDQLSLPIDPCLQARLLEWVDAYGALLDRDNPAPRQHRTLGSIKKGAKSHSSSSWR